MYDLTKEDCGCFDSGVNDLARKTHKKNCPASPKALSN